MSFSSSSSTNSIAHINHTFLLLARELARDDTQDAALSTGLSEELLSVLANAPINSVEALAQTPVCVFSLRMDDGLLNDFVDIHARHATAQRVDTAKLRLVGSMLSHRVCCLEQNRGVQCQLSWPVSDTLLKQSNCRYVLSRRLQSWG